MCDFSEVVKCFACQIFYKRATSPKSIKFDFRTYRFFKAYTFVYPNKYRFGTFPATYSIPYAAFINLPTTLAMVISSRCICGNKPIIA